MHTRAYYKRCLYCTFTTAFATPALVVPHLVFSCFTFAYFRLLMSDWNTSNRSAKGEDICACCDLYEVQRGRVT